jgi:hypothetical protein
MLRSALQLPRNRPMECRFGNVSCTVQLLVNGKAGGTKSELGSRADVELNP